MADFPTTHRRLHDLDSASDHNVAGTFTSGHLLGYDGTNWVPTTATGGGGSSTLAGLTDTDLTTPTSGQTLRYDGTSWVNADCPPIYPYDSLPAASADYRGRLVIAVSGNTDYLLTALSGVSGYTWQTLGLGE